MKTTMKRPFAIAIHGGVGNFDRSQMPPELEAQILSDLDRAIMQGDDILRQGGPAIDAAVLAVSVLEDSEVFNAGKGSALTAQEMVEMDAAVMLGTQRSMGAVAGIRHIKNPVQLAKEVMLNDESILLLGAGAEDFAFSLGYPYTEQDYFFTEHRYNQLAALRNDDCTHVVTDQSRWIENQLLGSVGAVVLDQQGQLAAATSHGGLPNKKFGQVSEVSMIGAGIFAENETVAVSVTGFGEAFRRCCAASDVASRMRYLDEDVHRACDQVLCHVQSMGGDGGLIAIDHHGEIHFAMNSRGMCRASINIHGQKQMKIYADDK